MAYIGKTPSQAVRNRYFFTASGGETSISSSQISGLTFSDGAYVDVHLNGVLLVAGTDYNTNTANTIAGLSALVASDIVEIVVYDTFAVFGGTFSGTISPTALNIGNSTAVSSIKDEDNMASDSATSLATQQSIKAYVDTQVATAPTGDITAVTAGTGLTGGGTSGAVTVDIDSTVATLTGTQTLTNKSIDAAQLTGTIADARFPATLPAVSGANLTNLPVGGAVSSDLTFSDSDKAIFGAGNDLQIYHDGSSSRIVDAGTGNLLIQADELIIRNAAGNETKADFYSNGAVGLYYDNAIKLATTATGVDVTGGLNTTGNVGIGGTTASTTGFVGSLNLEGSDVALQLRQTTTNTSWELGNDNTGLFRILNNGSDKLAITSGGNVDIGAGGSNHRLRVVVNNNTTQAASHISLAGLGYGAFHFLDANAYYIGQNSNSRAFRIYSGTSGGVSLAAGGTSWGTYSDERLKTDIELIENAVDKLANLRCVSYRLTSNKTDEDGNPTPKKLGLIAQDLEGVIDEVIDSSRVDAEDETDYLSVRYTEVIPVLVKAIQEQKATITALEARITALEAAE